MLRDELVERERWIPPERFNRVLAVYQAPPGPDEGRFYNALLEALAAPYLPRERVAVVPADVLHDMGIGPPLAGPELSTATVHLLPGRVAQLGQDVAAVQGAGDFGGSLNPGGSFASDSSGMSCIRPMCL
mgnify:CR=1 FL=1